MNIKEIVNQIKGGNLVITPTDTIYGILADAMNTDAIQKVYKAKQRSQKKPLIIIVNSIHMLKEYTQDLNSLEEEIILKYMPGPLTILLKKNDKINDMVTCGSEFVGVRIVANKELVKVITAIGHPLISTSANISTQEVITSPKMIDSTLATYINYIEDGGILKNIPSSIIRVEDGKIRILRMGEIANEIMRSYPELIISN